MKYDHYDETNWAKKNVNFGKWTYHAKDSDKATPVPSPPTDEQMIEVILEHQYLEEKDFFLDMVEWLRNDAPKKLRTMLRELWPGNTITQRATANLDYERLCEVIYKMGFRASEILERRMTLGQNNEWVKKYFEDFPPRQNE